MWIVSGIAVLVVLLAFLIPLTMSDGTEKLTGLQKAAAEQTLQNANKAGEGIDWLSTAHLKVRVENVYPTPLSEANGWCGYPTGKDTAGHYSVVVSYRSFFGITTKTYEMHNCAPPFTFYDKSSGTVKIDQ